MTLVGNILLGLAIFAVWLWVVLKISERQRSRPTSTARCPECTDVFEADSEADVGDLLYLHLLKKHAVPPSTEGEPW